MERGIPKRLQFAGSPRITCCVPGAPEASLEASATARGERGRRRMDQSKLAVLGTVGLVATAAVCCAIVFSG